MRTLLAVTAIFEILTGLAFVATPVLAVWLFTGTELAEPAALVVTRLLGLALLTLGGACWLARGDPGSAAGRGLLLAILFYDVAAVALLAYAGLGPRLDGLLLWPAVAAHAVLGAWCVRALSATARR